MDLFEHAAESDTASKPLAERLRPRRLEDFVGQEHVLGPGRALRRAIEADQVPSLVLWGPPGTGKTTLARLVAGSTGAIFVPFSALQGGVEGDPRDRGRGPRPQADGAEADHPLRRRDPPLLPRPAGRLPAPRRGRHHRADRRHHREPQLRGQRRPALALPGGDAAGAHRGGGGLAAGPGGGGAGGAGRHARRWRRRRARRSRATPTATRGGPSTRWRWRRRRCGWRGAAVIDRADAEEALQQKTLLYDQAGEEHYNVVSAFIKSLRGSDPDAAVYYLTRMLEAGEEPRFVLRRMVIFASEDVGNADPQALQVAVAALQAVELVGLPEGVLPMTQAAIYLALAPKSNTALTAYAAARRLVQEHGPQPVPTEAAQRADPADGVDGLRRRLQVPARLRGALRGGAVADAVDRSALPERAGATAWRMPTRPARLGRARPASSRPALGARAPAPSRQAPRRATRARGRRPRVAGGLGGSPLGDVLAGPATRRRRGVPG